MGGCCCCSSRGLDISSAPAYYYWCCLCPFHWAPGRHESGEYDAENPKIITKCEHHFHLACILEWMERSDTCPVCDEEMMFDLPSD